MRRFRNGLSRTCNSRPGGIYGRHTTHSSIETLKVNGVDTVYRDGELTGFGVRVRKSDRKNYVPQTRVRSKLCWFTIGQRGRIERDSNCVKNRFAPVALTKKNALLANHDEGGSDLGRIALLIEIA